MENKENPKKLIGKIYNYDGFSGYVITQDTKYLIIDPKEKNIQDNDIVSFYPDSFKFHDELIKVARDLRIVKKNTNKSLKKNY